MKWAALIVLVTAGYVAAQQGPTAATRPGLRATTTPVQTQPGIPHGRDVPSVRTHWDDVDFADWVAKTRRAVNAEDWKLARACAQTAAKIRMTPELRNLIEEIQKHLPNRPPPEP